MAWGLQIFSTRRSALSRRASVHAQLPKDVCELRSPSHWKDIALDKVPDVPGMTQPDELRYFYWCCATHHQPGRRVVELGPYVGRSTVALAAGLQNSAEPNGKLVSVDCFEWNSWALENTFENTIRGLSEAQRARLAPGQFQPQENDSFFPLFEVFTEPLQNSIHSVNASLETYEWCGDPIDVLMIDAAKSWAALDQIVRQFFPCLVDGAVVIHQDYKHFYTYWLHPVTERMLERGVLTLAENVSGTPTQGFRFHKTLDFSVEDYLQIAFTNDDVDRLLARSTRRFRGECERMAVTGARCHMLKDQGTSGRAKEVFSQALRDGEFVDNYALVDLLALANGWTLPLASTLIDLAIVQNSANAQGTRLRPAGPQSVEFVATPYPQSVIVDTPQLETSGAAELTMNFHADCRGTEAVRIRVQVFDSDRLPPFYDEEFPIAPGGHQPVIISVTGRPRIGMRWIAIVESSLPIEREIICIAPMLLC